MRESELRKRATCAICRRPIGACGLPFFYTVTVARHAVKMDALQRQQGLTMMLGGHALLAQVLGPDEEMTETLMEPAEITVCEECGTKMHPVAGLAEIAAAREEPRHA